MRNQFEGKCYVCGQTVAPGQGHVEKRKGAVTNKWRTIHAKCITKQNKEEVKNGD